MAKRIGIHEIDWNMNGENHGGKCLSRRVQPGLEVAVVEKIRYEAAIYVAIQAGLGTPLLEVTGYWA